MRTLAAVLLLMAASPAAGKDDIGKAAEALSKYFKKIEAVARVPLPGVQTKGGRFDVSPDGQIDMELYQRRLRKFPPVLNAGDSFRRLYFKPRPKDGVLLIVVIKKTFPKSVIGIDFGRPLRASDITRETVMRATASLFSIAGEVVPTDFDPEALARFLAGEGGVSPGLPEPLAASGQPAPPVSTSPPATSPSPVAESPAVYDPELTVLSAEVDPVSVSPGSEVRLSIHFELSGVPAGRRVPITVERQLYFEEKPQFPSADASTEEWGAGRQTSTTVLAVPNDAPAGVFRLVVTVRGAGTEQSKEALFVVE